VIRKPASVLLLLFTFVVLMGVRPIGKTAVAETGSAEEYLETISDIDKQIAETRAKLAEVEAEARTLQGEIDYLDNQIYLTQLEINRTQTQIRAKEEELVGLREDIGGLTERIATLGDLLAEQEEVFSARAREAYKSSRLTTFEIIFGAPTLSRLVARVKYLQVLELADQRLITQMRMTREGCSAQKDLLEVKKAAVEEIKTEIETYKRSLENQKAGLARKRGDREHLLRVTQGEEAKYREILNQLLAEKSALESIYLEGLTDGTEVSAGQPIALIGNSGAPCCSTGAHLHFEVRQCAEDGSSCVTINPEKYLSPTELVYAGDEVGKINASGDWPWPVAAPRITQEYGETFWTRRGWMYKFHTGIDMTSGVSSTITSVADGTLYRASTKCGKSCVAHYVAVDHGEGLWTIYFHVQ